MLAPADAAAAAGYITHWTEPCEYVDVTLVDDEQLGDACLAFARCNVQRRQTILDEIYIGTCYNITQLRN